MQNNFVVRLKSLMGLDFHILSTLVMRLWSVFAGGIMILGIPHWFTQAEQGYYFTFSSLIALQVFFELGFNYVVTQLVGHEMAYIKFGDQGGLEGDDRHLDRLSSLIKLLVKWYRVIAVLFGICVGAAGYLFFYIKGLPDVTGWVFGWGFLAFFSSMNLFLSPFLAVIEGAGRVGQVARLRLIQSVFGYVPLWILLSCGGGLWAVPLISMASALITAYWIKNHGGFIFDLNARVILDECRVSWRKEIFPFQWRIALSWISGYFIFQLFNPIVFAYQGAVAAGKIGLAMAIFSTTLSVAMSWVTAKAPVFAGLIAQKEHQRARSLFWSLWLRSGGINLLGCAIILAIVFFLNLHGVKLAYRLPDLRVLFCIAVVTVVNHFIFSAATYMRSHKVEPLMLSSIAVGFLSLLVVYLGAQKSVLVTMVLYAGVVVFVALPWCLCVFLKFLKEQH
jgi:hypothetical protein